MKFEIKNRWTSKVQFTAEIDCDESTSNSVKLGMAIKLAVKSGADLSGADLSGADLSDSYLIGAYLSGADLSDADLSDANLSDVNLSHANLSRADLSGVPVIENIHQNVFAAASQDGAFDMSDWHTCETTHCRAGWAITLAGDAGKALEDKIGPAAAAAAIYIASDPKLERIPDFHCSNETAMADMKRLAELEARA